MNMLQRNLEGDCINVKLRISFVSNSSFIFLDDDYRLSNVEMITKIIIGMKI